METLNQLHLLRPWCLLLLIPMVFLLWKFWQQKEQSSPWEKVCDPALLPYLLEKRHVIQTRLTVILIGLALLLAIIALTGPSWSKLAEKVYQSSSANVIVLDISPNMQNTDLIPNRFIRAKYKLLDLLKESTDGSTGLVVFSGEAYTVAPITRDSQTLINLATTLDPSIMPVAGENLAEGLKLATKLLDQAQANPASITVILGSTPNFAAIKQAKELAGKNIRLTVLDISAAGNPNANSLVGTDNSKIIRFTQNNKDIQDLLSKPSLSQSADEKLSENTATKWKDQGRWFILFLMLILLLAFRRGGWNE
jgi:Ca-activated chloride channel family protein